MIARLVRLALPLVALPILALPACGPTPPPDTPAQKAGGEPDKAPSKAKKPLAEHKREFMEGCTAKVPGAPDYCECGWEQMQKTFTEDELNAEGGADQAKLGQLKDRVEAGCKGKLPEDLIKRGFLNTCDGGMAKLTPYCDCTWSEYRKKMSAAELSDDAIIKTDRFATAKKDAVKACGPKMPEDVARQAFITGCAQDPKLEAYCGCAWKTIRAEKSSAEVEAGLVDMEVMKPKVEKACKQHRAK